MIINQEVWDKFNDTCSDFITNNFGVNCILYFGTKKTECPNCVYNSITGTSSNQYKSGGPIPFVDTLCPYCEGVGYQIVENTDTVKMRVYYTSKDFIKIPNVPLNTEDSLIQTYAFITDLPKLEQAQYIIVNSDIESYKKLKYQLKGEIVPHGMGPVSKFCIAFWRRTQ
jgi:hypothetical protein